MTSTKLILFFLYTSSLCATVNSSSAKKILALAGQAKPPFMIGNKGNIRGMTFDIIDTIAQKLNFSYSFNRTKFVVGLLKNNSWSGTVGEVISGRADVGISLIGFTHTLYQYVDFSTPFLYPNWLLLARTPRPLAQFWNISKPFSIFGWLLILFTVVFAILALYFLSKPIEKCPKMGFFDATMNVLGHFLRQGPKLQLKPLSIFIFTLVLMWFSTLIFMAFACNLRSYLISVDYEQPIDALDDVIDLHFNFYYPPNTSIQHTFQSSPIPVYKEVFEKARNRKNLLLPGKRDFSLFERDNMVILVKDDSVERVNNMLKNMGLNPVKASKPLPLFAYHGFVFPKKSALKPKFNKILMSMVDCGLIAGLESKYRGGMKSRSEIDPDIPLNLDHIKLALFILSIGCIGSLLTFLKELKSGEKETEETRIEEI